MRILSQAVMPGLSYASLLERRQECGRTIKCGMSREIKLRQNASEMKQRANDKTGTPSSDAAQEKFSCELR